MLYSKSRLLIILCSLGLLLLLRKVLLELSLNLPQPQLSLGQITLYCSGKDCPWDTGGENRKVPNQSPTLPVAPDDILNCTTYDCLVKADTLGENGSLNKINGTNILDKIQSYVRTHVSDNEIRNPKIIFIVTTWRSGSTFLGEAMSSHPAMFYHFEPLDEFMDLRVNYSKLKDAILKIQNLVDCNYHALKNSLFKNFFNGFYLFNRNSKLQICLALPDLCFSSDFMSTACKIFPIQLFKFVRIRIAELLPLFKQHLNAHIVYLVRDPRAVFTSRQRMGECLEYPDCGKPEEICKGQNEDIRTYKSVQEDYPKRIHLLKYEDLAANPFQVLQNLFLQLGISWDEANDRYLKRHTNTHLDGFESTYRISKLHINSWRTNLSSIFRGELEKYCKYFMEELHYEIK